MLLRLHVRKIHSIHKPLVPLLGRKSSDALPQYVLHFCMHLIRFQYNIRHVPRKTLYIANSLSRAPFSTTSINDKQKDTEMLVQAVINSIPASIDYQDNYRKPQLQDKMCCQLTKFCQSGWPSHKQLKGNI